MLRPISGFMRKKKFLLAASLALSVLGASDGRAQTASPPTVAVRAGAHDQFDRVVFDWPRAVKFALKRDGEHASIAFDAAGDIKFSQDVRTALTRARGFTVKNDDESHVTVSFIVGANDTIKTFTSSTSVVIDITGKPAPENVAAPPPEKTDAVAAKTEAAAPVAAVATMAAAVAPNAGPPKSTVAAKVAASAVAAPASPASSSATPSASSNLQLSDAPMVVAMLDAHVPTRAAIYQRADVGYIIFDRKFTLSASALENGVPAQVDLQALDLPSNSGFRFAVPPNSDLEATLDGTVWKIFLSKKQAALPVTTSLVAQPDFALGGRLLLPLPDAPEPVHFVDPVVGDNLILVPLAQSEAFSAIRHMSDLTILPAAQGLVIKPLNDKVIVRTVSDGIEVTAEGGLLMSHAVDTGASQQSASRAKAAAAGKSMFDFATWGGKAGESFTKTRQRLQQTIVDVPEAERNRARLELARFYFANGNGEEALSLLNMLAKQVPDLRAHADFMALVGASEILAYRSDDGLRDLSLPALADQPETTLWQAVGLAQQRDWQHAEEKFALRETLLTGYPEPFFSRFFVLAIESALAVDKDREASDWLDFLSNAPHDASIDPALDYLRGALHAKAGRAAAAEESWKNVLASNDQLYKVRAELALIDLGVSTGSLTPAQAADRLEALRFGWRGDDLEVDILHRLGRFYIEAKNPKAGLNAMSQAVTLYPASPMAPAIHAEMAQTFHDIFLGDLGKKMTPIEALTLYQQYRDLMPTGKDGDVVTRNLAERLVSIDLLDQASSLLEDLVKNHLQGEEKDRTALRLAGIRLLDHKPEESITALDLIGNDSLNPTMQNERVLLHARALSELHRDDDAKALLKDNTSEGAKKLRADIAMHAQAWGDAAKFLMDLVGPPPPSGTALTPEQSQWLINAAIAYALADSQTELDRLAIDYGAAMTGLPQNDTFRMLTEPEKTGQLRDLAAAQAQISQVDMFQSFLNNYRSAPASETPAKNP